MISTMRTRLERSLVIALGILISFDAAFAASAPTNAPASAATPALIVQPPFVAPAVPQSSFVVPKKRAEGRDPFFPKSDRVYGVDTTVKPVPTPVADLTLQGISGTPEQPLAIINNRTFTAGEGGDVVTKAGRMQIRCVEINMAAGTVLVQVGGERRELRLGR